MQNASSTVVITAGVPREQYETVTDLARAKHHSRAAEVRQALAGHIEREKREVAHERLRG